MTVDKLHALFFTDRGSGPDNVSLWTEPVPAFPASTDPAIIAPRTLGLRVGAHVEHVGDELHITPLVYSRAGGYQMDEATVRALHAAFGAWLNAPRDEARAAAEMVTRDDELLLVKTTLGEWGVGSEDEPAGEVTWFGGEHAEYDARRLFAEERGKVACLGCAVEVDEDDSSPATDDGDRYCPKCAEDAEAEFKATTFGHDRGSPGDDGCTWTGPGSKIVDFDEDALCPACGAPVQRVAMAAPASDAAVPA